MRIRHSKRMAIVATLALAALFVAMLLPTGAAAREMAMQNQAPRFAVLSLSRVLDQLDEKTAREGELQAFIGNLENRVNSIGEEMKEKEDELKILPQDAPEYEKTEEELVRLRIRYQTEQELARALAARRRDQMQLEIFNKILAATERYAEEQGIDLVISDDSDTQLEAGQGGPSPQQIQAYIYRTLLFTSDRVDISDPVAVMMNNEYHAGGGDSGGNQ